jgi:hypothetical protein
LLSARSPPKTWAEQLAGLALDEGISGFVLTVDDTATIDRFATEVVPAVRELVAAERAARREQPASERTAPEPASHAVGRDRGPASVDADSDAETDTGGGTGADTGADPDTAETALGVAPTPDSGVRLSAERLWDESERPRGPRPAPGAAYGTQGRALAGELVAVHDHLRGELAQLRDMIEQVAEGSLDPGAARSEISRLTMRQNQWTVGAYCESYCRLAGMHHSLEDQAMFPGLRSLDGRLAPVVDRLHAEHLVIAGVLARVDAALVAMVTAPGQGMPALGAAVDLLTDSLLSHLSYEEPELVEPLGRLSDAFYR